MCIMVDICRLLSHAPLPRRNRFGYPMTNYCPRLSESSNPFLTLPASTKRVLVLHGRLRRQGLACRWRVRANDLSVTGYSNLYTHRLT